MFFDRKVILVNSVITINMGAKTKIIKFLTIFIILQIGHLFAEVKFKFIYADRPGKGFHIRSEAKAALEEIANMIGSNWLKQHHANIFIQVISRENKCDACDNMLYIAHLGNQANRFNQANILQKILKSQTFQDRVFDDILYVDFSCPYNYNDDFTEDQCDFKTLMLHKMTQLLGFTSTIPNNRELFKKSIINFIKKAYYYCFNDFNASNLNELIEDIVLFQSINFDLDEYILEQVSSSFEILQTEFILALKNDIINKTPFDKASYPFYYNKIIECLDSIDSNMEEFLAMDYNEPEKLIAQMLQLGYEKIWGQTSSMLEISKIKKNFLIFYALNQEDDNYGRYLEDFIATVSLPEVYLECLERVIQFSSQYFIEGKMDDKEIAQFKSEISDMLSYSGVTLEKVIKLYTEKQMEGSFNSFDQFIINKNNEKVFDGKDKKLRDNNSSSLFFKGPKVLQYLGKLIPLQENNPSYVLAREEESVMNVFNKKRCQLRQWDQSTTAILLDLGYKVDNEWTQIWLHK